MNYAPIEVSASEISYRDFRIRARQTLARPGLRMHVIVATIVFLTMWVGSLYMLENAWYALDWQGMYQKSQTLYTLIDVLFYLTDALFLVFGALPLLYGYIRYLIRCATGTVPPLSTLFEAFGSGKHYLRALCIMLRMTLRYAVWLGGVVLLVLLAEALYRVLGTAAIILPAVLAGVYTVIGSIGIGIGNAVFLLDFNHPDHRVNQLFRASREIMRPHLLPLWLLKMRLLPLWLLGFLSLGTLLLFHSLPYCVFVQQYAVWSIVCYEPDTMAILQNSEH
jgi:hypothetical protein